MYREQNYIFSFTFVYKSKTACLIKHLFKKKSKKKGKKRKKKKKNHKYPQTTFSSIFWILKFFFHLSYGFGFILLQWHYFICNNKRNCMYEVLNCGLFFVVGRGLRG